MAMATIIAVSGKAWIKDAEGNLRVVQSGDVLQAGEIIITAEGASVTMAYSDGRDPVVIGGASQVALNAETGEGDLTTELAVVSADVAAIIDLLENADGDLLDDLEEPAAGQAGAGPGSEGHYFVRLLRIAEDVDPLSYEFNRARQDGIVDRDSFGEFDPKVTLTGLDGPDPGNPGNPSSPDDDNYAAAFSGAEQTVWEAGLADGSAPNNNLTTRSGSFGFSAPDGLQALVVGGRSLDIAGLQGLSSSPIPLETPLGTLLLTGFSGDETGGTISYTYILSDNIENDIEPGATNEGALDSISVIATDTDGSTATGSLDIAIIDDVPAAIDDRIVQADEDENQAIEGNVLVANGTDGRADIFGADGKADPPSYPSYVALVDGSLTGIGELELSADGSFKYTPGTKEEGEVRFDYTITDGDGDTSTATVTLDLADDSKPTVVVPPGTPGEPGTPPKNPENPDYPSYPVDPTSPNVDGSLRVVDEAGLSDGSRFGDSDANTRVSGVFHLDTKGDDLQSLVIIGADVATDVTAAGEGENDGIEVRGEYGTLVVTKGEDGLYKWDYTLSDNTTSHNSQGTAPDNVRDIFNLTVTDSDGDSDQARLGIDVRDDVPVVVATGPIQAVEGGDSIEGSWGVTPGADGEGVWEPQSTNTNPRVWLVDDKGNDIGGPYSLGDSIDTGAGELTVNSDNTWRFKATGSTGKVDVHFRVEAIDGDGDTASDSHTITITDGEGPTIVVPPGTDDNLVSAEVLDLTLQDKDTLADAQDSDTGKLRVTAGSDPVTRFEFGNDVDSIKVNGNGLGKDANGDDYKLEWRRDEATGNLIGKLLGVDDGGNSIEKDILTLSLDKPSSIAANSSGDVTVIASLADNLPHSVGADSLVISGVTVVATDSDESSSDEAQVTVTVEDDTPDAVDFIANDLTEDTTTTTVSGDVFDTKWSTGNKVSQYGADGKASANSLEWTEVYVTLNGNTPVEGVAELEKYGRLTQDPDGTWSFDLDNNLKATQKLTEDDRVKVELNYDINDSDSDTDGGTIEFGIQGVKDTASITSPGEGAGEGAGTVYEAGLDGIGSGADDDATRDSETTYSALDVKATSGIQSVTIGNPDAADNPQGRTISIEELQKFNNDTDTDDPVIEFAVGKGTIKITGYQGKGGDDGSKEGTISYSYTLNNQQTHPDDTVEQNTIGDVIDVSVESKAGSDNGKMTITIVDDVPTAVDDRVVQTDEDENQPVSGNVLVANGTDGSADVFGADGKANAYVALVDGSLTGAGQLNLDADGTFTYRPGKSEEGEVRFDYTITDGDGDTATATVALKLADDSKPEVKIPPGNPGDPSTPPGVPGNPEGPEYPGDPGDPGDNIDLDAGDSLRVVDEAGLDTAQSRGSDADATTETTSGTFDIDTKGDSLKSLVINGTDVTDGGIVTTDLGTLTVTKDGGDYNWSYELGTHSEHKAPPDGEKADTDAEYVRDIFNLTVIDSDGDKDQASLGIDVKDDVPHAVDFIADDLTEDTTNTTVSGDVFDTKWSTDGKASQYGADGKASANSLEWKAISVTLNDNPSVKGVEELEKYGRLTQDPDGTWSFDLNNNLKATQKLTEDDRVKVELNYDISDSDSDTDSGTIEFGIQGVKDTASITSPGEGAGEAAGTVYEAGLDGIGSGADDDATRDSETTYSTLDVKATSGIESVTIGNPDATDNPHGRTISIEELQKFNNDTATDDPVIEFTAGKGTIKITDYQGKGGDNGSKEGTISYRYTLNNQQTHPDDTVEQNTIADVIDVSVKSLDGSDSGEMTITIVDDVPKAADFNAGTLKEDGSDTDTVVSGNVLADDGVDGANSIYGADGAAAKDSLVWGDATLSGGPSGEASSLDAYGTLEKKTAGGSFTGEWEFMLDSSKAATQALKGGETITVTLPYTLTDGDKDSDRGEVTFTIEGHEDAPPTVTPKNSDGSVSAAHNSVTEDTGATVTGTVTVSAEAGVKSVSVGGEDVIGASADNPVVIETTDRGTLTVTGYDAATGVISYEYTEDGDAEDHRNDQVDSFTVTVMDNEGDTWSEPLTVETLDTAPTARPDTASTEVNTPVTYNVLTNNDGTSDRQGADGARLTAAALADSTKGRVSFEPNGNVTFTPAAGVEGAVVINYTITDADGDTSTATLTVNVTDDSTPAFESLDGDDGTVDEAWLEDGSQVGVGSKFSTGTFRVETGGDSLNSLTIDGTEVPKNGQVTIEKNPALGTLTVEDNGDGSYGWRYELTDNSTDHKTQGRGIDGVKESFAVVAKDSDGSEQTGSLDVLIRDDIPVVDSPDEDLKVPVSQQSVLGLRADWINIDGTTGAGSIDESHNNNGIYLRWSSSGYNFVYNSDLNNGEGAEVGTDFSLGTFTHINQSIDADHKSLDKVDLKVSFTVKINGTATDVTTIVNMDHTETKDPGIIRKTYVDDVIEITNSTTHQTIMVEGREYILSVEGFKRKNSEPVNRIETPENANSSYDLFARISSTDDLPKLKGTVTDDIVSYGADGPAGDSVSWQAADGNGVVSGEYGTLTTGGDGSYTYEISRAVRDEMDVGESRVDTFTYYVFDQDGDRVQETLEININGLPNGDVAFSERAFDYYNTYADVTWEPGSELSRIEGDNDINDLKGTDESELIIGKGGDDDIDGGAGDDFINGSAGNDDIIGGKGSDELMGDDASGDNFSDTFIWELGDAGTSGAPAEDRILDFTVGTYSSGSSGDGAADRLSLGDLLEDYDAESDSNDQSSLDDYIHAEQNGSSTTLYIKSNGGLNDSYSNADQKIKLENVSMGGQSSSEFLTQLIDQKQLDVE